MARGLSAGFFAAVKKEFALQLVDDGEPVDRFIMH
jgi:hypothetical protein